MPPTDLTKQFATLYSARNAPALVDVPALHYLMCDAEGDPNTSESFKNAVAALFSVSYGLKFAIKKETGFDYKVGKLEGLYRLKDNAPYDPSKKGALLCTLIILQPDVVTSDRVRQIIDATARKKPNPKLRDIRFQEYDEGRCVQIMHTGPFDDEMATMERVHAFMDQEGLQQRADHHEIYLTDALKTAPDRLRTILRIPVTNHTGT